MVAYFLRCGLRLTGLAAEGSIPLACVGLGAFLSAVFSRLLNLSLLVQEKREVPMTTKHKHHVLAASMLDVISGTGTGIAAGALLA